jgi:hypothetical protein
MSSSFSFLSEDVSSSAVDLTLLIIQGLLQTCSHYRLFRGLFQTCNANIDLRLVRAPCSMYGLIITVVITIDPQLGDEPTACLFFLSPPMSIWRPDPELSQVTGPQFSAGTKEREQATVPEGSA